MKRKRMILWGAAIVSAALGLEIAVGKDGPPSAKKGEASAPEAGAAAATGVSKTKIPAKDEARPDAKETVAAKRSADEEAILLTGETYVKAYCSEDAKKVASHFTADAEFIDVHGEVYRGRDAIEAAMKELFAEESVSRMEMDIESIRFISPGVAVEDGVTICNDADGDDPVYARYTAVHVKTDGRWLTASVREHSAKDFRQQHRAQLQKLAWLQGDWVDEGNDSVVIFSCEAVDRGNFLIRKFAIKVAGQEAMTGTQRIGWDPVTGKLKAWIFDSEGGYSDGFWHRDGKDWVLKSSGVTADGQAASSTTIYTLVDEQTMTWKSVDHEIDGEELPDSEVVTIVRRAPVPQIADDSSGLKSE